MGQKQVFVVHTEYHLIHVLGIINTYYSASDDKNLVVHIGPFDNPRIRNINSDFIHADFLSCCYDYDNPNEDIKSTICRIIEFKPSTLFFFNDDKHWLPYLVKQLKSRYRSSIVLLSDGMNFYNDVLRTYRFRLSSTWKNQIRNIKMGHPFPLFFSSSYMGSEHYIDEVWTTTPNEVSKMLHGKVVKISIQTSAKYMNCLFGVFHFESSKFRAVLTRPIILFIDTPITDLDFYERDVKVLDCLMKKFPNRIVAIKQHPNVTKRKDFIGRFPNIIYLDPEYPAELYISCCTDAVIVSVCSTSLLTHNEECSYYWTYPLYSDLHGFNPPRRSPVSYIKVVSNYEEIRNI